MFARLQDSPAERARYVRYMFRLELLLLTPFVVGVIVMAPAGVPAVFSHRWVPAVPTLQLAVVAAFLQANSYLYASTLNGAGRPAYRVSIAALVACLLWLLGAAFIP